MESLTCHYRGQEFLPQDLLFVSKIGDPSEALWPHERFSNIRNASVRNGLVSMDYLADFIVGFVRRFKTIRPFGYRYIFTTGEKS